MESVGKTQWYVSSRRQSAHHLGVLDHDLAMLEEKFFTIIDAKYNFSICFMLTLWLMLIVVIGFGQRYIGSYDKLKD